MKPLPDTFRSDGFDFRLLRRDADVVLLVKSKPSGTASYEVVILQHRPAEIIGGIHYPPREAMPRSADWGISGWSYATHETAEARFQKLVEGRKDALLCSNGLRQSDDHTAKPKCYEHEALRR